MEERKKALLEIVTRTGSSNDIKAKHTVNVEITLKLSIILKFTPALSEAPNSA